MWTINGLIPNIPVYTDISGAKSCSLDSSSSELDFVLHFIDEDVANNVKEHTNLYARTKLAKVRLQNKLSCSSAVSM